MRSSAETPGRESRTIGRRALLLFALGMALNVTRPMATAEDLPAVTRHGSEPDNSEPATAPSGPRRSETADREQERRRAYTMGIVMIGGILISGVGLLAVVLLWGSRTRRIARQPLPRVAPRDELFYLKNKPDPAPAADTELEERDTPPG